jgi:chromosome segregation protein
MKLKQLEIVGFKSFADKTTVQFPHGICAVVGPNGCGKSNIVDALRWVMGEQSIKHLRGKAMEDVIFSGSEKKDPLNMAEVVLTVVNDNGSTPAEYRHFSEIMVSRRLYRSGESQYFINKQPCRLKDVQNLLAGSGLGTRAYAIVEQGKIGSLIDAGPEERRFFIEEAAGVTRYKSRKHDALLKINRTQQNLLRIHDVVSEIKRQMTSLKRQARKAERYKLYQEKIKELEIRLSGHEYQKLAAALAEAESLLQSLRDADFRHGSELAQLDAAIEQIKQERAAKYESISEQRARRHNLQRSLDRLEGDIAYRTKDLERLDGELENLKTELKSIEEKTEEIARECHDLEAHKSALLDRISQAKETVNAQARTEMTAKAQVEELNRSLEAAKASMIDLAGRKATYENTLENASRNRTNLSKRLDQLNDEKFQAEQELLGLDQEKSKVEADRVALQQTLTEIAGVLESLEAQLRENRTALSAQVRHVQESELERQKARSQYGALKKMEDNYEWYKQGVRAVMQEWKSGSLREAGIQGLVADVVEPEPSYESAVEAAFGEKLQYIIVKDLAGAVAALDSLRALSAGRGSFVPLEGIRPLANGPAGPDYGTGRLLINHIKVRQGFEALIRELLGGVAVADDLESAMGWWKGENAPWAVVTKTGDRISPQGILTGGGAENGLNGILTKKKELKDLAGRVSELGTALEKAKAHQKELEYVAVTLETQVQQTRQNQNAKNQQLVEIEKSLYRLGEQAKHAKRHLEILHLEEQQLEGERTDVEEELSRHQEVLAGLTEEIGDRQRKIEQIRTQTQEAMEILDTAKGRVVELRLQLTTHQAEYDNTENTLRRLTEFQRDRIEKRGHLERALEQIERKKANETKQLDDDRVRMSQSYSELKTLEETLNESETEYQAIEGALQQNDQALSEVRTRQQATNRKIQELELSQSERRMRRDHIATRILEKYHEQLESFIPEPGTEAVSVEDTENRLTRLRDRITKIGEVNLTAIEEYENLSERHTLLTQQRDDLIQAIDALHRIIRKINRVSLKRFMKTFKAVNEKVQQVFPKLFEGGSAQLALTEPRKPLESGISFLVRPPGKKLTRMSLLSGGEKALSAIALIFSLFLIKPAAFCVLDEIDAPLDDVNTYRFNQLLKEIGKESQVVMITHDRQTMEVANALFGVTMEQKGISKLVSLSLQNN